jgi:putative PIN family toxin of toxin-antitoxin system
MRIVIDTNVLISALLNPGRTPDRALSAVRGRGDVVLYDARVLAEYRDVLSREKFRAIGVARAEALIVSLITQGESVIVSEPYLKAMIDEGDRIFVEVALAGRADALATGNARDYPTDEGFDVLPPAALLARMGIT